MTKPQQSSAGASDDYRHSHLERGGRYDSMLAAAPFDAYMAEVEKGYLQTVVPSLFPATPPRYLDFACGTGRIVETVAPFSAEAVGVDISESMLQQARQKVPTARFVHADLTQSQTDLGQFDLITSFRFFGNAQDDLRRSVLGALHRHLKPEGYLIINSHRNPHSLASLLHSATGGEAHGMDLSYFRLKSLLRDCGFGISQIKPIGAWMYRSKVQGTARRSPRSEWLERMFGGAMFAPIAPDALIVARKVDAP